MILQENLGCTLIATFGTEGTKSAIQTACRGYRSDEYPNGIDVINLNIFHLWCHQNEDFYGLLKNWYMVMRIKVVPNICFYSRSRTVSRSFGYYVWY